MHHVSKIDPGAAQTPKNYESHSTGFRRVAYVDRMAGSVHMGAGICFLDPGGLIQPHLHAFEETFYILEGSVVVDIGERAYALGPGHFGLIATGVRHAWRSAGDGPVRWLEMQAPQPRPLDAGSGRDTFFVGGRDTSFVGERDTSFVGERDTSFVGGDLGAGAVEARPPGPDDALLGHFDEAQLPRPGAPAQMEGFNATSGVAIKMFVDRSFGAIHQSLFLIQYMPGAKIDLHDHTFEESYFVVGGRVRATADGQVYDLGPGEVIWAGVGCVHSFENVGAEPVRWIETQAPLPPAKEVFRFERDWMKYAANEPT